VAVRYASLSLVVSVIPQLEDAGRFVLVTYGPGNPYDTWLAGRLPAFAARSLGNFGKVNATIFERGGTASGSR
jgi:hypothetical protein